MAQPRSHDSPMPIQASHVLSSRSDAHFNDAGTVYVLNYPSESRHIYLPMVAR